MRKIVIGSGGISGLKLVDAADPEPGPGEVLVLMHASSLNYRDLVTVRQAGATTPGLVPNSCGAGEVVAVGDGVRRIAVGDRVAPMFFQKWVDGRITPEARGSTLGGPIDGCLRDLMVLNEEGVTRLPDDMTFEEAATLPCAGLTAWRALVEEGNLKAGETVLVQGTGGVSIFALQFARLFGAEVIVTSSSDAKLERARALGATHVINYRQMPDWASAVRQLTGGRGVDHVVEVGGADTLQQSIASIALGGNIHVIGVLGGYVKDVDITQIFRSNGRIQGVTVGSRAMFERMLRAMHFNGIHPVIDARFPLENTADAFELMARGGHFGKIVIEH
ncbi:MAG: NAD(P)-dependent alcohol dehydrogenase [Pseudomonadales bacterium]|nr:NAD(P)-dependent alcohol dehydrogenase [Pseudomonadales bacterium]